MLVLKQMCLVLKDNDFSYFIVMLFMTDALGLESKGLFTIKISMIGCPSSRKKMQLC